MVWFFGFFFVSGFCSLMYEVIWLRLAMAQFGVTTPMVSLVLSTFMLGLGLGSWGGGYLITKCGERISFPPLRLYAVMEFLIGLSAFAVPFELALGRQYMHRLEIAHGISSLLFYCGAGAWIAVSLAPWCACMGATFPCALFAIKKDFQSQSARSFSYLYLANVLGAMAGAVLPLLLIEEVGFSKTLSVGALLNFLLSFCAWSVAGFFILKLPDHTCQTETQRDHFEVTPVSGRKRMFFLLFATGLTSMAAEVVWVRMFTAWLGTVVYSFAAILALYLAAAYVGSFIYRRLMRNGVLGDHVWALLGLMTLIPLLTADPRLPIPGLLRLFLAVVPFSAILGFVTPYLLDRVALGDPGAAGFAYSLNIVGCVLGPLIGGFILLPTVGERGSLLALAFCWFAVAFFFAMSSLPIGRSVVGLLGRLASIIPGLLALLLFVSTRDFATQFPKREVRRDYTATVIATGYSREGKRLIINGVGITNLTPETKLMAHLPLAFLGKTPSNALDICFGMGTTHRSLLSWGISSTAVELVPSVPSLFGYFYEDGPELLRSPRSRLIIDDGRFYLERSDEIFDVITIDPPPPVEAAGSSLLYSKEFYAVVRRHLRSGGILQQWLPNGDAATIASVAKALRESFPYVRVFGSIEGQGFHFLARLSPVPLESALVLASHVPPAAATDLLEWGQFRTTQEQFAAVLTREVSLDSLIQLAPGVPILQDDRPVNEYFLLRRLGSRSFFRTIWQRLLAVPTNG
jgi:spermidine synthase